MNLCVALLAFLHGLITLSVSGADASVTVNSSFASQYMFRGVRLGGPSFQPSVEMAAGDFTAGLWANKPMVDRVAGISDPELDFYFSYAVNVNDNLNIAPGATAYFLPNAGTASGLYRETYEPYLAVNYTISGVKLTPKVYYDAILQGPTFELNAAYTVSLEKLRTKLDFSGSVGTYFWDDTVKDASPRIKNSGSYYQIGVALPFEIGKHSKLTTGVAYTDSFENYFESAGAARVKNTAAIGRVIATISLSFTF